MACKDQSVKLNNAELRLTKYEWALVYVALTGNPPKTQEDVLKIVGAEPDLKQLMLDMILDSWEALLEQAEEEDEDLKGEQWFNKSKYKTTPITLPFHGKEDVSTEEEDEPEETAEKMRTGW